MRFNIKVTLVRLESRSLIDPYRTRFGDAGGDEYEREVRAVVTRCSRLHCKKVSDRAATACAIMPVLCVTVVEAHGELLDNERQVTGECHHH